jgi:hypothetical protein
VIFNFFLCLSQTQNGNNNNRKKVCAVLTSGSVAASVTQAPIHVIKYMASFVIFPGCWLLLIVETHTLAECVAAAVSGARQLKGSTRVRRKKMRLKSLRKKRRDH